ncbi:MAG: transporter substrate-binding domain-containing protein [Bacteroidales bacterium]|jgi:ABC-type amino acid transport substrate-binding protein|nr:transporter substrate-binding domain-containing protein [Bacteroidales bacterium]
MRYLIIFLFLFFFINVFSQKTELKLASDIWPPFTNVESEKAIALDLVREALARNGIKASYEIIEFDDVITHIDNGSFDGSAALWFNDERASKYIFSEPYLQNQLILVGRKGSDVSARTFSEIEEGKIIGIVEDYAYDADINSEKIHLESRENDQQNLERLLSGEIDYMLVDDLLIQYLLKYQVNDVHEFLEIADYPILVKPLYFALRKDLKNASDIITAFNGEIKEMIAEGTYNRILELNWITADVDGDGSMELILDGDAAGLAPPERSYEVSAGPGMGGKPGSNTAYYIEGKKYSSWDDIPKEYKTELIMSSQDPSNTGIKLNF